MIRKIHRFRALAFSLAVAGALTFGAGTALAAAGAAKANPSTCPFVRTADACTNCCGEDGKIGLWDSYSCICAG